MKLKTLTSRLNRLDAYIMPLDAEEIVITLHGVDGTGAVLSTREIRINPTPHCPPKYGGKRRR